ncbi:MAG TPA: hypothetical protein V6D20_07755 [Candidatus Obscuribacterales bacterium]
MPAVHFGSYIGFKVQGGMEVQSGPGIIILMSRNMKCSEGKTPLLATGDGGLSIRYEISVLGVPMAFAVEAGL